ncbi:MAG: ABC transporter permease subunit [Chloroflexota bacterium]
MADLPPNTIHPTQNRSVIPAFLRDQRILSVVGQLIFAFVLVYLISLLWGSIITSLSSKNLTPSLNFLTNRAGFDIAERPEWYSSNSSYGDAFIVGVTNSLRIIGIGLVLTTILGVLAGIFLLSSNFLLRNVTRGAVELLRNTPILIQLIFWYAVVIASMPDFRTPLTLLPEGRYAVPIRWLLELAIVAFLWFGYLAKEKIGSPRRLGVTSVLLGVIVAIEAAFIFVGSSYGLGALSNMTFVVYALVSIVLIAAATRMNNVQRWRAIGLTVGQFVGGLIFYFGILPSNGIPIDVYPSVFISRRGFAFPEIHTTARFADWLAFIAIGVSLALVIWIYLGRITEQTGRAYPRLRYSVLAIVIFVAVGWVAVGLEPDPAAVPVTQEDKTVVMMSLTDARAGGLLTPADEDLYSSSPIRYIPPVQKVNAAGIVSGYVSGTQVSPEYIALLLGLVVYTAAFIAEIVRSGILAVPKGQIEASRALGFGTTQTLWMIILPQAMRVIIPPLASQYLNLAKNSSLAIAIAFADIVSITQTIMNQSGQSVTGITMIMLSYLTISLVIAFFTNLVNRRFQLVTR